MNTAILLAAGKSQRAGRNKLTADVHGRPLWTLAYETLSTHPEIDQVILVVPAGEEEKFAAHADCKIIPGGETRMDSFKAALAELKPQSEDIIIDHNAANPNVTVEEITQVITEAKAHGAAAISLPAVDTILTEENGEYKEVLDRDQIRLMQTPQAVRGDILDKAVLAQNTDLTSALIKITPVKVIDGNWANQKITFASDLKSLTANSYIGEDSHQFSNEGTLKLGGLEIPSLPGMQANSDGDVILHAIGRALAQAHDQSFAELADRMCSSGKTNSQAYLKPLLKGIKIHTVSIQIEAARPKIRSLALKPSLAKILKISEDQIRISAMTGESLTEFGHGKGIKCTCILTCS
jgi:2-C-methyl-D-erythritol 4-phosphate cytidylyltransferase/2-C-methyl-D-erythritol 2,4-cyclodiphosphate synthase